MKKQVIDLNFLDAKIERMLFRSGLPNVGEFRGLEGLFRGVRNRVKAEKLLGVSLLSSWYEKEYELERQRPVTWRVGYGM